MKQRILSLCLALALIISTFPQISTHSNAIQSAEISYEMRTEVIEFKLSDGTLYYKNTITYPYFWGNTDAETKINNRYASIIENCRNNTTDFDEQYQKDLKYNPDGVNGLPFYDNIFAEITYCDNGVISVRERITMWSGGMHEYTDYAGYTYLISDGRELLLSDILVGSDTAINDLIYQHKQGIVDFFDAEFVMDSPFVLTDKGLCFICNTGDAEPRAEIVIPYTSQDSYVILAGNIAHNESGSSPGRLLTQMKRYDKNGVLTYDCIYEYNALGQLTGTRHRYSSDEEYQKDNITLTYTYDSAGRLLWAIHGEPIATYAPGYNSGARYTYNNKGQLVNEIFWEGGAVEEDHEYDLSGKRTKTFYNADFEQGEEKYIYSESGRLERVDVSVYSDSDKRKVAYTYPCYITCDEQGRVIQERKETVEMPSVTTYDYSYLPFVVVHTEWDAYSDSDHIELRTENDLPLITVNLSNPTFYADDSGYLAKIVDKPSYSDAINTYEFYYDGELALPAEDKNTNDAWEVPELLPSTASFNTYFVENYYDSIMQMLTYRSVASDIVADSSSFQINWNVYLSALADEDFIPLLDAGTNSHYYYELALMESIARTKLNNEYMSSLTGQVTSLTLDAASLFVEYDADLNNRKKVLEQSLLSAIPTLGYDPSIFYRLKDYYKQYCSDLDNYETIKAVYDLVAEMNGSLEDFLSALNNYAIISQTNQEILAGLKFLRNELEKSSIPEDKLILKAVNNLIIAFDQDMDRKLTLTVLKSTEEQLTNIFQAAMETVFGTTYEVADFVIDASSTLSNVFYPTTISSASYCKIYADYALETVLKQAMLEAYKSYLLQPDEQTASAIVGLYDLLERTYSHEIEVANVLSEQLHKDGLVNGLRNLFFDGNLEEYRYEQECIQSYGASLNQIVQAKILAKQGFGLSTGELQPYSIVALCGKGVVYYKSGTVKTGSTNNFTEGIVLSSNFFLDSYEISGYYLDEAMTIPFDQSQPVMAPLSLYCNVRVFHEINRDYILEDNHSNICVRGNSFADSMHLSAKEISNGEMYEQVTADFSGKKVELYDISLMDNGIAVQPDGDIVVEIPVTDDCANLNGSIYRVEADGTYTNMNAIYQNKCYCFKTSHFSYYVIAYEQPNSSPFNWLVMIVAVVVCGLTGASILIWRKKRKN